jgi:hypothetical protein
MKYVLLLLLLAGCASAGPAPETHGGRTPGPCYGSYAAYRACIR